jgi:plastocyanin
MSKITLVLFLLIAATLQGASVYKEVTVVDGGTIRGKVVWKSAPPVRQTLTVTKDQQVCGNSKIVPGTVIGKDGAVPNAVIYLDGITAGKKAPVIQKVHLDQKNCEYVPHILIVPPGAEVEFTNGDAAFHNVHTYNLAPNDSGRPATIFNLAFPVQGQKVTKKLEPGAILTMCDGGHPWMSAHIFVTEHPYYAVTDANGNFSLESVPPGRYTLKLWQEGVPKLENNTNYGFLNAEPKLQSKQVSVGKKETVTVNFEL